MLDNRSNTNQQELSNSHTNAEENQNNNNSSQLREYNPIIGTPFIHVRDENKHFAVIGDYRITEICATETELFNWMYDNEWQLAFNMMVAILHKWEHQKSYTQNENGE